MVNDHTAVKRTPQQLNNEDSIRDLGDVSHIEAGNRGLGNPWRELFLLRKANELLIKRYTQNPVLTHSHYHGVHSSVLYIYLCGSL